MADGSSPQNRDRSEGALAALYDAHAAGLYRYALMILTDGGAAEDAVQQAFAGLARLGDRLLDLQSAEAYLRKSVRNECYTSLRQRRRRGLPEPMLEPVVPGLDEVDRLAVEAALRSLPPEQREVVHLKVYEGRTFQEIAQTVGVPADTAASRYRYALARLRATLAPIEGAREKIR